MCGINGFTFADQKLIERMNITTRHRGPDASGVFVSDGISLGNDRLKIIDLSEKAAQPMHDYDNRLVIVYNGELYNFKELKRELQDYPYRSESDTEVILAAYRRWGYDCLKKFNGMFALAIWDTHKQELFLARDHAGIKPLYYTIHNGELIFSSEIKSILEHGVPRHLDQISFEHYLRLAYVPAPRTMFKDILKFPLGHYGVFKEGSLKLTSYLDAASPTHMTRHRGDMCTELHDIVEGAVSRQLISDRPLGVYLSGGIDSSVVLSAMSKTRGAIDTFSVGYELRDNEEREKFNTDFLLAKETAAHFGTNHHEVLMSPHDVVELFPKLMWHLDEPISNPTALPMMKLAQFTKEAGVDVVLSGDGGDELFGGYPRYRLSALASLYQRIVPAPMRTLLAKNNRFQKLNTPPGIDRFALFMFQKNPILSRVLTRKPGEYTRDFFKQFFKELDEPFETQFMRADQHTWLPDESLTRGDKTAMAGSVEGRVPLLDREVIAYASTIPLGHKVTPLHTKIILKEAFKNDLPAHLFGKKKRGWISPGAKWLRYPNITNFAQEVLSESYDAGTAELFHHKELRALLDDHVARRGYYLTILWMVLSFKIWARTFQVTRT